MDSIPPQTRLRWALDEVMSLPAHLPLQQQRLRSLVLTCRGHLHNLQVGSASAPSAVAQSLEALAVAEALTKRQSPPWAQVREQLVQALKPWA